MNANTTQAPLQTTVFNLIIIDESGSMSSLSQQTVSGCNEVLNTIRSAEKSNPNVRQLVSIYLFQSNAENPSHYLFKNVPIAKVRNVTPDDYRPWGGTPLLDAVGMTLTDVEAVASTHVDAVGLVTVITDGEENSSRHYTYNKVASIISRLKEMGWTFNIIGANIDVVALGKSLAVDNTMKFQASSVGTAGMYGKLAAQSAQWYKDRSSEMSMSQEDRVASRKKNSKGFFKK